MERIIEDIDTKITSLWGVAWDEQETVRDFLQNFYDANPVDDIKINISGDKVSIFAPAEFDYRELEYLGSDKSIRDLNPIGKYGEGYKAALLNAMRNWNCGVEVYISDKKLRYYFKEMDIGRSQKKVIFRELSEIDPVPGTTLIVSNCTARLIEEFKFGLNHFYYDDNPLMGNLLVKTYAADIAIYESTDKTAGYVFYKRLLRSKIELPVVIVCSKEYKNVDNKIDHDRDRKAFTGEVLEGLLKQIFRNFRPYELAPMLLLVKDFWEKGNKHLAIIAECYRFKETDTMNIFPENYYAKESIPNGVENSFFASLTFEIIDEFRNSHYICCPRYMSYFGMKTPDSVASNRLKERQSKINRIYSRELSALEKEGVDILAHFIKELSADLYKHFENARYIVGESDDVIGELKKSRRYNEQHVFLNTVFFTFPFSDAMAILLHEWAHIYGYDGSRGFSDALTGFIAMILDRDDAIGKLKSYVEQWKQVTQKIQEERIREKRIEGKEALIKRLTADQAKEALSKLPEETVFKIVGL